MKLRILGAIAIAANVIAGAAAALTVTIDTTVTESNIASFLGQTGTITLTYEPTDFTALNPIGFADPSVIPAVPTLPSPPDFDFSITMFGQTFTDVDDPNASLIIDLATPTTPLRFNLVLSELEGVAIDTAGIISFNTILPAGGAANLTPTGVNTYSANIAVSAVPLPAGVLLLGAGLAGLGLRKRLFKA